MPGKTEPILRLLVGVDFSDCSHTALRRAFDLTAGREADMTVVHVIDPRFARECVEMGLFSEGDIKKKLFLNAKAKLKAMLEEFAGREVQSIVCEGMPYLEINRQADKLKADIIVIGSCGMVGKPEAIFFGGTAEKILRFTTRPVLCVPPDKRGGARRGSLDG
ncbi:MAG: universal stress protein [Smithella sp.]